ncbi:hypothetical protein C8R45DRAFT_921712 [Mycena sanguinolenta]|nr:hypothetical protein C8R45DRAFT_921712 [Mycena sanguinolenta]
MKTARSPGLQNDQGVESGIRSLQDEDGQHAGAGMATKLRTTRSGNWRHEIELIVIHGILTGYEFAVDRENWRRTRARAPGRSTDVPIPHGNDPWNVDSRLPPRLVVSRWTDQKGRQLRARKRGENSRGERDRKERETEMGGEEQPMFVASVTGRRGASSGSSPSHARSPVREDTERNLTWCYVARAPPRRLGLDSTSGGVGSRGKCNRGSRRIQRQDAPVRAWVQRRGLIEGSKFEGSGSERNARLPASLDGYCRASDLITEGSETMERTGRGGACRAKPPRVKGECGEEMASSILRKYQWTIGSSCRILVSGHCSQQRQGARTARASTHQDTARPHTLCDSPRLTNGHEMTTTLKDLPQHPHDLPFISTPRRPHPPSNLSFCGVGVLEAQTARLMKSGVLPSEHSWLQHAPLRLGPWLPRSRVVRQEGRVRAAGDVARLLETVAAGSHPRLGARSRAAPTPESLMVGFLSALATWACERVCGIGSGASEPGAQSTPPARRDASSGFAGLGVERSSAGAETMARTSRIQGQRRFHARAHSGNESLSGLAGGWEHLRGECVDDCEQGGRLGVLVDAVNAYEGRAMRLGERGSSARQSNSKRGRASAQPEGTVILWPEYQDERLIWMCILPGWIQHFQASCARYEFSLVGKRGPVAPEKDTILDQTVNNRHICEWTSKQAARTTKELGEEGVAKINVSATSKIAEAAAKTAPRLILSFNFLFETRHAG